jgi:8-oxo-dGTP pyrophosphatase MutT (NUDIX family)
MTDQSQATPKAPSKVRALRPRDAATLIIVDDASGEARVLLGRRRSDMVFMPGRYVFPGGRVDRADRHITVQDNLKSNDVAKLLVAMKGAASQARARALALAAVREP